MSFTLLLWMVKVSEKSIFGIFLNKWNWDSENHQFTTLSARFIRLTCRLLDRLIIFYCHRIKGNHLMAHEDMGMKTLLKEAAKCVST